MPEQDDEPHAEAGPRLAAALLALDAPLVAAVRECVGRRDRGGAVLELPASVADHPDLLRRWYMGLAGALGEVLPEDQTTDGRPLPPQWFVTIPLTFTASSDPARSTSPTPGSPGRSTRTGR